jgi:hypothetical protein
MIHDSSHAERREPKFSQIPTAVLRRFASIRKTMPGRETLVSSTFVTYTGLAWFRNRVTASNEFGRCYASNEQVATLMGQSEATVKRNKKMLEDWRLIFIEGRPGTSDFTYFIDDPTAFDAIANAHGRGAAERAIVTANEDETDEAHSKIAASAADRPQMLKRPRSRVSHPQVTGELPPGSPVRDTQVTGDLRTEDRTERSNREGNRAPSNDGVGSSSELTHHNDSNNAPLPAAVASSLRELAAAKSMPPVRMTPAQEQARRLELRRQLLDPPTRLRKPYKPLTDEEWAQKEREARATAARMLEDCKREAATQPSAPCRKAP